MIAKHDICNIINTIVKYQPYTLRNVLVIVEQPIYSIEDKGEDSCMWGSTISKRDDCETACNSFPLDTGTLKDGYRCYQAGNGKCRQDGREGSGASLICESKLYNIILLYLSVICLEGHKYRISQHVLSFYT